MQTQYYFDKFTSLDEHDTQASTSACSPQIFQIPSPPASDNGAFTDYDATITVSTAFYPGALPGFTEDVIFLTSDCVHFYLDRGRLVASSDNGFNHLNALPPLEQGVDPPVIQVYDNSELLNLILHVVLNMPLGAYAPSLDALQSTIARMPTYGIQVMPHLQPLTSLFSALLALAPLHAIEIYCLAAEHHIEDLAVPVSSHLLAYPLFRITDEMATEMGPVYLRRLFFMHLGRMEALKRLVKSPPYPHSPSPECDFMAQKRLSGAWELASAGITWDLRPDLSTSAIKSAFRGILDRLACPQCKETVGKRVDEVVVGWSQVKCTI